jgi:sodium-dependent dicarboxylate transporter 2/3/5
VSEVESSSRPGRTRTWIGAIGSPLAFVVLWLAPLPLEPTAHRLAAVFAAVLVAWLTEVIPIAASALLVAPLLVITGVARPGDAFRHYADPLLFLFVGGFFIAEAMRRHRLDRRIAKAIVTSRWVGAVPSRVRIALMMACLLLSMWISNTAAAAIVVPVVIGMSARERPASAAGTLLAVAYACSAGGLGTLVGSPPNLITVRLLREGGVTLGFLDWLWVGLPAAALVTAATYLLLRWMLPQASAAADPTPTPLFDDVPARWTRGEITTAVGFGLAVVGWTLPGVLQALESPLYADVSRLLEPGVVALVAATPLFAVPDEKGEPVLPWRDATRIDWGVILLFGGGIALGTQLVETGLAARMSEAFVALTGIESLWTLTAACCVFTIFFTEICSNTATANMLIPLVVGVATELGVSPIPPALAVGLAASCAFMLPIATGPNAIVYGTGLVTQGQMVRVGFALNVTSVVLIFLLLRLLCPLLGWA